MIYCIWCMLNISCFLLMFPTNSFHFSVNFLKESKVKVEVVMDDVEMSDVGAEAAPEAGAKVEPAASVAPGEKVMADSGVAATVSVSLHPLVIMNISEHWTRYIDQSSSCAVV